jgi:hypothetical protein
MQQEVDGMSKETATGDGTLEHERDTRSALHRQAEAFFERWKPENGEHGRFHADLMALMSAIYADAAKPMEKALTAAMSIAGQQIWPINVSVDQATKRDPKPGDLRVHQTTDDAGVCFVIQMARADKDGGELHWAAPSAGQPAQVRRHYATEAGAVAAIHDCGMSSLLYEG